MSRLVRAERTDGEDRLWIVAGTAGAVEHRLGPHMEYVAVHSARQRPGLGRHNVPGLLGILRPGCYILESPCWMALADSGRRLRGRPDWALLEDLYARSLGGGR